MATVEETHGGSPFGDGNEPGGMPTPGSSPEVARSQSLLEQARQRRAERETHLFVDVPSWDGDLIAEYQVIGSKELEAIAENAARKFKTGEKDTLFADLDLIAKANVGLYMLDPESGDRVALEDEHGIVGFDRAAGLLGMSDELKSVVDTIKWLTGERKEDGAPGEWKMNPTAISMHANRIARWMRDPSKSSLSLEEILGES